MLHSVNFILLLPFLIVTMRGIIIFFTLIATTLASGVTFENLEVEKLLQNEAQRKAAFDCILDQGPCGEMQGLRDSIPHLIKSKCSECSPKMKQKYEHLKQELFEKYPEKFNALVFKYSSEN